MPLYDFTCDDCGEYTERYLPLQHEAPKCCNKFMRRVYSVEIMLIKEKYPLWVDRMDDIHKAQTQRGERLRYVHPREIRAT